MSYTQFTTHEVRKVEMRYSEGTACLTIEARDPKQSFEAQFFLGRTCGAHVDNAKYHDRAKRAVAAFNEAFIGGEDDAG